MIKKHMIPSIFFVSAFFELFLGAFLTYKLSLEYAEPFGFFNFLICVILIAPVIYMVISLIGKGLFIYKIRAGEYGKVYEDNKMSKISAKEITFYILGAVVFALGLIVSLVFSFSLAFYLYFEFVVFAIPMFFTIYISMKIFSKAINETYYRKYSKIHKERIDKNSK